MEHTCQRRAAASGRRGAFDLFLTTRKMAIVVLGNGLWPFVRPMLAQVAAAIEAAEPGSYSEVEIPTREKKTGNS
jgi:hypothetical protein